eukprot:GDKJ01043088.1.p1 GENE.GDKJ01043088.1~~GDKJ01043088.1.p1  ORF type:complete len:569 (-),score=145.46 GDKJ01043088.1:975-2681(-)
MGLQQSKPSIPLILGAGAAIVAVAHWYAWSYRFPKGASLSYGYKPIIGHLHRVLFGTIDHDDMMNDIVTNKNKTCVFVLPLVPWIVFTSDSRNVEYILKTNFANFPKGPVFISVFKDLLGDGIFNSDGMTWYQHRKTSSPMFATNVLRHHFDVFRERCFDLIDIIKDAQKNPDTKIELYNIFNRFSLECIGEVGFGVKIGCLQDATHPFLTAFDFAQELSFARITNPVWQLCRLIGTAKERKLAECCRLMDDFTYDLIRKRRAEVNVQLERGDYDNDKIISTIRKAAEKATSGPAPKNGSAMASPRGSIASSSRSNASAGENVTHEGDHHAPTRDFISLFIAARPDISDHELRDCIVSLLIAGRDTSAQTLVWCIWELMQNPEIVKKIREELVSVVTREAIDEAKAKGERFPLPNFDQIRSAVPYLTAVVHETFRLHPPVPRNLKQAVEDCYLPDGTFIPAGSMVLYAVYAMSRDSEVWGKDCEEFRPERWLALEHIPNNYVWPVFQGGPRECLGRNMALFEIKVALCALLASFDFTPMCDLKEHSYVISATLGMTPGLFVKSAPVQL